MPEERFSELERDIRNYEGALRIVQDEYNKGKAEKPEGELKNLLDTAVYLRQRIEEMKQCDTDV